MGSQTLLNDAACRRYKADVNLLQVDTIHCRQNRWFNILFYDDFDRKVIIQKDAEAAVLPAMSTGKKAMPPMHFAHFASVVTVGDSNTLLQVLRLELVLPVQFNSCRKFAATCLDLPATNIQIEVCI